jgi:hypothetical protein
MGLGPTHAVSLAEAREAAEAFRKELRHGRDPLADRGRHSGAKGSALRPNFQVCAEQYIEAHHAGWKNPKVAVEVVRDPRPFFSPRVSRYIHHLNCDVSPTTPNLPLLFEFGKDATRIAEHFEMKRDPGTVFVVGSRKHLGVIPVARVVLEERGYSCSTQEFFRSWVYRCKPERQIGLSTKVVVW